MAEVVEGEWNDFVFRMVGEEQHSLILDHLHTSFYPHEVLCQHLDYDDTDAQDSDNYVISALAENLSFVCVHKESNKIAGVRITVLTKKGEDPPPPLEFKGPKGPVIINLLTHASSVANVFGAYHDVDEVAEFFMTSVDPEFRGRGIATEMYNRAIKLFKTKGIKLCKGVLTSPFTRQACANLGFREMCKVYLKEYKDKGGNPFFPRAGSEEFISVVVKQL